MSELTYDVMIGPDADNLQKYISTKPSIQNNRIHLHGSYFGSSTRINPIGTIFNLNIQQNTPLNPQGKHIRVIQDKNIILDFFVSAKEFMNYDIMYRITLGDIIIYARDLHRFDNYPVEISGISFLSQ